MAPLPMQMKKWIQGRWMCITSSLISAQNVLAFTMNRNAQQYALLIVVWMTPIFANPKKHCWRRKNFSIYNLTAGSIIKVFLPRGTILFLLVTLLGGSLCANDAEVSLKSQLKQLVELRLATLNAVDDEQRLNADKQFVQFLKVALADPKSFKTAFDTIPQIGDLRSGDGYFRMINWNVPLDDQTHRYRCFIQHYDKKTKQYKVIELEQGYRNLEGEVRKIFSQKDWYGCLYYDIIPSKTRKIRSKRTYMVLGWDGHDQYSSIKVVDVLVITKKGVRFGADIFDTGEPNIKRLILEYKSDAAVTLRYEKRKNRIVFNQLVPMQPDLEEMREFYIPVMEFDALVWKKRRWRLEKDVEARMKKTDTEYVDPPKAQRIK